MVAYLPAHPEINRPLTELSNNLWTERIMLIVAIAMAAGAMFWIAMMTARHFKLEPIK